MLSVSCDLVEIRVDIVVLFSAKWTLLPHPATEVSTAYFEHRVANASAIPGHSLAEEHMPCILWRPDRPIHLVRAQGHHLESLDGKPVGQMTTVICDPNLYVFNGRHHFTATIKIARGAS
jgi:hypothetical protein